MLLLLLPRKTDRNMLVGMDVIVAGLFTNGQQADECIMILTRRRYINIYMVNFVTAMLRLEYMIALILNHFLCRHELQVPIRSLNTPILTKLHPYIVFIRGYWIPQVSNMLVFAPKTRIGLFLLCTSLNQTRVK